MNDRMEDGQKTGWFHCGRCGSLFAAEVGGEVPDQCPDCGRDPVVGSSEMAFVQAAVSNGAESFAGRTGESHSGSKRSDGNSKRKKERKKERSGLAVFVGIWLVILVVLATAVKYFQDSVDDDEQPELGIVSENDLLVSEELNECKRKVMEFLEAGSPEGRVKYVINPIESLRRMSSWQQEITLTTAEEDLNYSILDVIETPNGKGIETVWELSGNRQVEAVFFEDDKGEWKIDWANMVRFSDHDWALFLLGTEQAEGEFRLLARRRSEDHSGEGKVASVVLVGPRPGTPGELGASSPEVEVDPDSRTARVLSKAFAKLDAGEGIYGSEARSKDPNGMIRLRVRVVREPGEERSFAIREILACHWYDLDDLGLSE
ncbi:hypothetical protein ACFQY0_15490 [Haloferula chungangensis]|uniref:Zinc ribbon domain-containing protein n=1 Tax=Haloferula chungangensis TaxID=1048331 RepID=A0ABW2L867_9BACT